MKKRKRTVRQSQTLTPFGVGGIIDVLGESLVACDTRHWKQDGERIRLARLAEALRVREFRAAPSAPDGDSNRRVPYYRFPRWLFCGACHLMTWWSPDREVPDEPPVCPTSHCGKMLVPMRFVMICANGHLADVPWDRWAHSRRDGEQARNCYGPLEFRTSGKRSGGLDSLLVRCKTCRAERNLRGITVPQSMKEPRLQVTCPGHQPWQAGASAPCDAEVHVVQRGASNVYFPLTRSALDIPPGSNYQEEPELDLNIQADPMFGYFSSAVGSPLANAIIDQLASRHNTTADHIRSLVDQGATVGQPSSDEPASEEDLLRGEWYAFLTPRPNPDHRDRFIARPSSFDTRGIPYPPDTRPLFEAIQAHFGEAIIATRLREVRALTGFSRYEPGVTIPTDLVGNSDWLPAIEVFGEGVFLTLNEARVAAWENHPQVRSRVDLQRQRLQNNYYGQFLPTPDPRFVLLHTLAHLLIRQLSFECGYSSSSLRERIYSGEPRAGQTAMAGILIYTAAGDSEGTMGGLARQGDTRRLVPTVLAALQTSQWCSSDPICQESSGQGNSALNRAACHACSLVSETSCAHMNSLLDRVLLVGNGGECPGFFEGILEQAAQIALSAGSAS